VIGESQQSWGLTRIDDHEFETGATRKMRPSEALDSHRQRIRDIVKKHRARNARVFGSVLRGTDDEASDVDLLVDATESMTLFDLGAIQYEVSQLLGIGVDVLTPGALPEKWRDRVLREAQPL
jgi:predicted nucleotidyltransferase